MFEEVAFRIPYQRCVREVASCDGLYVGDLLWVQRKEPRPGGYEYAVCYRRGDGMRFDVRLERLEDSFELDVIEEKPAEWMEGHEIHDGACGVGAAVVSERVVSRRVQRGS